MKSLRPMLIGQAPGSKIGSVEGLRPSTETHDRNALVPSLRSAGDRFRSLLSMSIEEYDLVFDRVNVSQTFPGSAPGKGDAFDPSREEIRFVRELSRDRKVIALGRRVSNILGHHGDWLTVSNGVLSVPHTSGICMKWNDPAFKRASISAIIDFLNRGE